MIPYATSINITRPDQWKDRPLPVGAFWRTPPKKGQKRRKLCMAFKDEHAAEVWKKEFLAIEAKSVRPVVIEPERPTKRDSVAEFMNSWLRLHIEKKKESATYRSYEQLTRLHIIPTKVQIKDDDGKRKMVAFGDLKMSDLKNAEIVLELFASLHDHGTSLPTRRHAMAVLSSACRRAVVVGVLPTNPCYKLGPDIKYADDVWEEPEPNPYTRHEMIAFLNYVAEHEPSWLEYFTFAFHTGARVGEISALKWEDCKALDQGELSIGRSYSPAKKDDKKTKTGVKRLVELSDDLRDLLMKWKSTQRAESMRRGLGARTYVFTTAHGTARRQDSNMRVVFNRVDAAVAGVFNPKTGEREGTRTPHQMRHTFACLHLSDDYSKLPWVSKMLGHKNTTTTTDIYFKYLPTQHTKGFANQIVAGVR